MCRQAPIRDAEIQALCRQIIDGQRKEIAQMELLLQKAAR
jgi:uncharacterized protein (DUF305 family)